MKITVGEEDSKGKPKEGKHWKHGGNRSITEDKRNVKEGKSENAKIAETK